MHEGPIVVGVDGSSESLRALDQAAELAEKQRAGGGLDLVVVHVRHNPWLAGPEGQPAIKETLDSLEDGARRQAEAALAGRWLTWRYVVRTGDPARELVKEANEQHAAAITIGGHRHSVLGGALVHSVAASLVHEFDGSLLIVRGELAAVGPERS
jgi:nucleotide-binding universal stress UspA family protein